MSEELSLYLALEKLLADGFKHINERLTTIMSALTDLQDAITNLRAADASEGQQITTTLADVASKLDDLNTQIANGATPEQLQAATAEIQASLTDHTTQIQQLVAGDPGAPATPPTP